MKTLRSIILGLVFTLALVSCDTPVSLGSKLDIEGPVVFFTTPFPRKAVPSSFILEGTVTDKNEVSLMIIKVERNREELPFQWRYSGVEWEFSDDSGATWRSLPDGVWEGKKSVVWSIPVNLVLYGEQPKDGEYVFSAIAWDRGGITDDNSFKTLVLIVDNDPPKVSVNRPLLYDRKLSYDSNTGKFSTDSDDGKEIEALRNLDHWRYPEYINKFQTSSFPLQWSIEDNFNIWSFDLRFYSMDVAIDNDINTPLPDDYIYRFYQNTPPVPDNPPSASDYVKPNGTVNIPSLSGPIGNYPGQGEIKKQIIPDGTQTTIRVVTVCYDAANNATQEKTLGYFVYWPEADIPWITFSGDIKAPEYYNNTPANNSFSANVEKAFLVYPGVNIKAIAFHAQGIQNVKYSITRLDEPLKSPYADNTHTPMVTDVLLESENSSRGKFDWEFLPEPRSAYYVITAVTLSSTGNQSAPVTGIYRVQDITFPDFPVPVQPPELEPLFKHIKNTNSITISGIVSDATAIDSLCLVWINPQSKNAAAMAQLEYFRDSDYIGWKQALALQPGGTYGIENNFDSTQPNKVWRLAVTKSTDYINGINPATQRVEYKFSRTIPLLDLNISTTNQPLKSQVFLLRASNPNPRATVISYTPQGDEGVPTIKITSVSVNNAEPLTPGSFSQIKKFKNDDTIKVTGTWTEDSVEYMPFITYLQPNFSVTIGNTTLTNLTFPTNNGNNGTWEATATVKTTTTGANQIPESTLKDTLVVSAKVKDIGGNQSEDQASWLIESDTLRIVRISSELADQTYKAGTSIDIFIEFNKAVMLKSGRANPVLNLRVGTNTTITATYKSGQNTQNTRQYFTYNVAAGQNTTTAYPWLDVSGLNGLAGGNYWEAANYPFTWEAISATSSEEIRVTMNSAHTENPSTQYQGALLRHIPVAANTGDLPYTLARGKNIGIDTTAPSVTGVYSSNKAGHYALGSVIDVSVVFSEDVKITGTPQLNLNAATNAVTAGTPTVNKNTVTFSYTVKTNDTTKEDKLNVSSFASTGITDIAGNDMAALNLSIDSRNLNGGGSANNGAGIYVNTVAPGVPTFRALTGNNNTSIISNTVNGTAITGESSTTANKNLQTYYGNDLYFAIMPYTTDGSNRVGYLEYTLDALTVTNPDSMNWKRITNTSGTDNINGTPFKQDILGNYVVRVRQTDKAGNKSAVSYAVSLNWDPGTIVSRIDSTSSNGTYTNNSVKQQSVNVTVYFRKPITFTGTVRLNVIRGTNGTVDLTGSATTASSVSYTYQIGTTDNTPTGTGRAQYLDVTAFSNVTATDAQGVNVANYIQIPTDTDNRLGYRKDILIQTGALAVTAGPTYAFTATNDQATGTITLTFNRSIIKNTGSISVIQQDNGYRLPAVLTESQATKYMDVANFGTYYKKGTNGFSGSAPDTSTKYVLDYAQTTVVTPANTNGMPKFAYDFRAAESVSLPITSQDITVSDNTLTINITGSNALQTLGASYNFSIPANFVQDSLGFQWPTTAQNYNGANGTTAITTPSINRPFVRIDKKISEDRIESQTYSATQPHLLANFDRLLQTRARLDCRTPGSIVRYAATGTAYEATGATTNYNRNGQNWRNGGSLANPNNLDAADKADYGTQPALLETGTSGTSYDSFTGDTTGTGNVTHITVGTNSENGYVWRVSVRSRNGTNGNTNSGIFEEIAFRTVLTYQLDGLTGNTVGQNLSQGDQLWIRGGDAISSSSVPGFPLTWSDDYNAVRSGNRRAGVRLLRRVSATTDVNTTSVWRWITWEINVRTWHDVVLGRGTGANTVAQDAADAWQFGPVQWAYPRGGWVALKDDYTLYPGKHRWMRISNDGTYSPGGAVNYSLEMNRRIAPGATTVTMPPAP